MYVCMYCFQEMYECCISLVMHVQHSLLHRELINAMAGTLFRDKAQLVQFIRYLHPICFPPKESARDLLLSMSASKNSAERALKEVGMNGFCCAWSLNSVVCND